MNSATAISNFRLDYNIDTTQISDANALIYLNRVYRKAINIIRTKVDEDYFYNEWTVNSVVNQREYSLEVRTSTIPGIVKLKGVSIKYKTTDTEYVKAYPTTMSNLDRDLEWYITNQPQSTPFYIVSDKSIFIYPAPNTIVTAGVKLYGISDPIDLTLTSTEAEIKIPLEYHDLLPLGMGMYVFRSRGMINEKNDAKNDYLQEEDRMIKELSDRIISPIESEMPYISNLG